MTIQAGLITIDTLDCATLGTWWCEQLEGEVLQDFQGQFMMVHSQAAGITLGFQQVSDPAPGKNRVHLDFQAADREAEVAKLVAAGATRGDTISMPGADGEPGFTWTVMNDPAGNVFCVADKAQP